MLCISLLAGCNLSSADNEQPQQKSESMRVNTVTLTPLTHYDVTREYVGTIQAGQQANLGFELNGKIARLLVDVGDKVNKGEPMVVLDTQLLQTQADQLKAQQAQVTAQLDLVEANLKRQRSLKNKGFSAEAEIDNLNSQRNALRANYRQLGASLAANILQQEKSTIYAPYDGTVSARHISTGDVVNLGAPTLTLLARTQQEAHIGLPAKQLAKLKQQQNWSVRVGNQHYPVSLLNPGARVDLNSRTVQLRFALPADAAVIDGELAYLEFNDRHQNPGYWIPLSSLTDGLRGVWNVFALQEHSQGYIIERRSVQVLYANNEQAYINGAIEANEKIVADGLHRLVPGQTVELIKKLPLPLNNEGA
ncbi:efflux transporter periplasmic adaptor subunit [Photobacterium jeanii]|uniref:Efflux transporter periplasmic adaptor subunit n=1 Tax=Photobacterium jeanii TaxID=858640 RepID=A0A178KN13_9GAMM|nr:efflux transporter periplasmic adaptor subunit [Photobacterium jeanii]